ncbi:MAG: sugar phosphate isomerase/epimerase, partial [Bacilli bacterium]|nr:sugar phosphate isomerase/epimerase [Bacilli bacterium]
TLSMLRIGMMTETIYRYAGMKGALKLIKDLGFECADVTMQVEGHACKMVSYFNGKDYKKRAQSLKAYADKIKLPLVQSHATFPSYKDGNIRYNRAEWKKLVKAIEICGILEIKNLVIHPLNDFDTKDNIKFYEKLLPYARKANVTICVENMWRWNKEENHIKPCSCSFSDSFNAIIDGMNTRYVKACVDIGHAEMFKCMNYSARKMLEEMNNRVVCLHIHDNDQFKDKHWIPFKGKIDYKDVVRGLKKINYRYDLIAEVSIPSEIDTYEKRLKYWREIYQAMKKFRTMMK